MSEKKTKINIRNFTMKEFLELPTQEQDEGYKNLIKDIILDCSFDAQSYITKIGKENITSETLLEFVSDWVETNYPKIMHKPSNEDK